MPRSRAHKQATRERILDAAAEAVRVHGPDGISVASIMKAAGLTHGGFYAHFASKDELIGEALARATRQTHEFLESNAARKRGRPADLAAIAAAYLSVPHYLHPERGCALAACAPELSRSDEATRRALGENVSAYLEWLSKHATGASRTAREGQALGALAAMVGGMILARSVDDPKQARGMLSAVADFIKEKTK
jgi:TetR/AcrR family transcriptional repressor of nem operon